MTSYAQIPRQALLLAKPYSDQQVLSVISVTVNSVTFPSIPYVIYIGKMISNKQRAKHFYPVLEMLNSKITRLKMQKCKFKGKNILQVPDTGTSQYW